MRQLAKKLAFFLGSRTPFYHLVQLISHAFGKKKIGLRLKKIRAERRFSNLIGNNAKVLSGPFEGLIYPFKNAFYSSYSPKILGCYEAELHGHINELLCIKYDLAIDIGSAEGYYAVGLLHKVQNLKLLAYDADETARKMTEKMAEVNGLSNRILVKGACNPSEIENLDAEKSYLIVCDCEGYENQLFTIETIKKLKKSSLLVELHDQYVSGTTQRLSQLFEPSHEVSIIKSNPRGNQHPVLVKMGFAVDEIELMLSEERDGIMGSEPMNWLVAKPK